MLYNVNNLVICSCIEERDSGIRYRNDFKKRNPKSIYSKVLQEISIIVEVRKSDIYGDYIISPLKHPEIVVYALEKNLRLACKHKQVSNLVQI